MDFKKKILSIGAGYVGGPTMSVIALKCPDYRIELVDINKQKIEQWNSEKLPIYEPGLDDIVKKIRGKNLFFSTDIKRAIREADIIFVSVNTPTKTYGLGAGMASDLQYWEQTANIIVQYSTSDKIIVEKSTLPVRTAEAMGRILRANEKCLKFEVISNPEFLAEGTAINDLINADRVLIGHHQTKEGLKAAQEIINIYTHWLPRERVITTNVWSAELSKLIANAFLAQRISSINATSQICEKSDADVDEVAKAIGTDNRIGEHFLKASAGFGGSCFKKDILNLVYIARTYGLDEVANYWEMVVKINEFQKNSFVRKMIKAMFNTVAGKKIAILGFAFKANTGDTRESAAIDISRQLLEERAILSISDPKALTNAKIDLADQKGSFDFQPDPYKACENASAIALMTEWNDYKELDYPRIYKGMKKPAFIFDGRNILNHQRLYNIGFNVYPLGKRKLSHLK